MRLSDSNLISLDTKRPFAVRVVTVLVMAVLISLSMNGAHGFAADFSEAEQHFFAGRYEQAEAAAAAEVDRGIWNERWPRLLIQCQLTTGQYAAALQTYDAAVERYPTSLTLRMLGVEAMRYNQLPDRAADSKARILQLVQTIPGRFASRENLVAAGRYFADRGEDARQILALFYDRVRDADPTFMPAYIATAELALEKGDYKVAAETLQQAQRVGTSNPRVAYLLARAWEPSDSEKATQAIASALQQNPKHIPSLLLVADHAIDREKYDESESTLQQVLSINPHEPEAWALRAVLAHLRGESDIEVLMRAAALSTWENNPQVDHLIGRKLSQKYRFQEGADYQRQSLSMDAGYSAARFQLAQDLLRLGYDDVGWQIAHEVADEDEYNVVAHNLIQLHDRLKNFSVLEMGGIHVRMDPQEAEVYGDAVLELLTEAEAVLCEKYDIQPTAPIVVEIFPEQKDFAIRTFGLPGGAGFLGVCFGRVITANSPASQGPRPSNWRSVLWHEFCHVVTLEKTKNRMPRWLSEGISVYEERQRNPAWGESMTPQYRQMLLDENLTRVSNLSAAFLSPPSAIHLQFAYFESSLVVEFLIENHGIDALQQILNDLGDGLAINDALARSVGSIDRLDSQFADYARGRAESFAPEADWSQDELPEQRSVEELQAWVDEHPNNYWGLRGIAEALVAARQYEAAKGPLERLQELDAVTAERGGPLEMLAAAYRETDETEQERQTLEKIVELSSDALPALRRLMEMAAEQENWSQLANYAQRVLSINPLIPVGHEQLARAAERRDRPAESVRPLLALSTMDPIDPAAIDFRIAQAMAATDQVEQAKHHVLRALVEAPRYRDAHRLLLQLSEESASPPSDDKPSSGTEEASDEEQPASERPPSGRGEETPVGEDMSSNEDAIGDEELSGEEQASAPELGEVNP
ncbi:tetratricopeptide repeat protein [Allorhodopirellula solitaria]|uniref:Tetratricopeptide repeat protein n=1 Tax=Allorhodopirellula solitaria TaxID=2527987 RepID=A0A5C5YKJ5_9BACT|nr:tetratricopeptide repeat protein [Allorhodopirellula solitaria]TWT75392.1 tetratricopeptide repeat protein [Allorhodopirellula solitaria]